MLTSSEKGDTRTEGDRLATMVGIDHASKQLKSIRGCGCGESDTNGRTLGRLGLEFTDDRERRTGLITDS